MNRIHAFVAIAALVATSGAAAQAASETSGKDAHEAHHAADAKTLDIAYAEGEVRKVDKDAGKITLKHGPIPNLDMPAMSMVFRAKEPAMLDQVKPGDKIRFKAEKVQGALTITAIQEAK